jgi:signal transduction histidine kinase/FixJ family two-component response regulator
LLAAPDRDRRDAIKATLAAEVGRLSAGLAGLAGDGAEPLGGIAPVVSSLTASLAALDGLVAGRLETSERIATLRHGIFRANEATQQLLAPWLEVTGGEVAMLVEEGEPARLASLIELQGLLRTAQAQVSAATEMLAEASTADQPERLPVLAFQLDLALRDLEATAAGLDPRLRPLLLEQVTALRALAEGPQGVVEARRQELALVAKSREVLEEIGGLSAKLTAAVDELGSAARRDIGAAIDDALDVQRLSTRVLVVVVALSLLTSALIVWLYVGRNIVRRLTALSDGMLAIAGGHLHAPVVVGGGDEIAAMGRAVEVFRRNTLERDGLLAEKAQAAERLEKEIEQRTAELSQALHELEKRRQQLEDANKYKSRFLASASHDLRQPLHALNLFAAQLRADADPEERVRLVARINAAVGAMNELFEALLDMSKLDAGVLEPDVSAFPVGPLLARMETTFGEVARAKGLRLQVVPSGAWVRSDFILLERILLNLVSNAVRHTARGGVLIGCRRRGGRLRIDVCDSGAGIAEEERRRIFGEFVQLARDPGGGLGLGLSIVDRLGRLLGHPVEMDSRLGRGSRFSVTVPLVAAGSEAELPSVLAAVADPARGKLVVVIDDDVLALDGMGGILRSGGCDVVTADSGEAALAALAARQRAPDLVISDYRLAGAETGIAAIERLRAALGAAIPAFLVSGDTAPERLREARAGGCHLLHKPVAPMRLRAIVNQLLKARGTPDAPRARGAAVTHAQVRRRAAPRPR